MIARRPTLVTLALLCALVGLFALWSAPALAARGHEFKEALGTPCTVEPCVPGTLKDPVAVGRSEETGRLYVADKALKRVTVLDSAGAFVSQIAGPAATGTGDLTSGSATVTGVATETGAFVPGEEISGPGIPSGTTVEAVASGELTLSQAATATATGAAVTAHQDFSEPEQVALDNACARRNPPLTGGECEVFDPSAGDVYVIDDKEEIQLIDKFTASGEFIGQITGFGPGRPFSREGLGGIAVDASGRLYVAAVISQGTDEGVGVFDNARLNQLSEPVVQIIAPEAGTLKPGLALDSVGGFYLNIRIIGGAHWVVKYGPAGEQLAHREFTEAEAPTGLATDPASGATKGDLYIDTGAQVVRFAPSGLEASPLETLAVPAAGHGAGLTLDTASDLYLADSAAGVIDLFVPQQPAKPSVESVSLSDVSGDSATLQAEVNPRGEPSTYRFEYGPCETPSTCASSPYDHTAPVPDGSVGEDFEVHAVSIHPQGLQPGTAYHFRIVVENPLGTGEEEKVFTTQPAGGSLLLPDNREWEMVSQPDKHAGLIEPIGNDHVTKAAVEGSAVSYTASASTEADPEGNSNQTQVLSARGPAGWVSHDIASPHQSATGLALHGQEYPFFSADLSAAILQPNGAFTPQLSSQATEQTAYLRTDFPAAEPTAFCTTDCYRPLVTGKEGFANVPPGTVFGQVSVSGTSEECGASFRKCGPQVVGATPDLSHLALAYESAGLTATPGDQGGLYEWSAAAPPSEQLQLLSVLPDGQPAPSASLPDLGSTGPVEPSETAREAISTDGSRVFFTTAGGAEHQLYLRYNALQPQSHVEGSAVDGTQCTEPARACTVQLDALQGGTGAGTAYPVFQLATVDGARAFFIDTQALTADAGEGEDLYEYDLQRPVGQRLADLTPKSSSGESAQVNRDVIGASADASYLYFAASGTLGTAAQPGKCNGASAGDNCNLYLDHEGQISLIAPLSAIADRPSLGLEFPSAGLTARVSPDGRWLAFMSSRPLTGYDNRDAKTGKPDEEVFLYHAPAAGVGAGILVCASCNPTGARPHGAPFADLVKGLDGNVDWQAGQGIAASLPAWTSYKTGFSRPRYQPRYLSNGGRLFFNATDSLVPQDTNSTGDVYQYEPPLGEGAPASDSCTTVSSAYSPASQGCVELISSGTSAEESGFLDASENGQDVFFFTGARLSGSDVDTARDVYDAHACTLASPCPPPPPPPPPACSGDACQNAASAPNDPTPGSLSFQGPGNLTFALAPPVKKKVTTKTVKCKKPKKHNHGKCVKTKAKKQKAKRAANNRRVK